VMGDRFSPPMWGGGGVPPCSKTLNFNCKKCIIEHLFPLVPGGGIWGPVEGVAEGARWSPDPATLRLKGDIQFPK
jgi:hypothetical protein